MEPRAPKTKRIRITYVPKLELTDETYEAVGEKAGYFVHSDEKGGVLGYRLFLGEETILIPKENVLKISLVL